MIEDLNERERFIYHVGINVMINDKTGENIHDIIEHVRKHRCRHLSDKYVHELLKLMRDELNTSKIMWEEPYQHRLK
jgi:pyridoxine 5'-phosphate synthase PdxJ